MIHYFKSSLFLVSKYRNIVLNASSRVIGNIVSNILALFALPFITRALGPSGYGEFNFILVVISYVTIFANWGFLSYGTREVANRKASSDVVSNIISARITISILSVLIFLIFFPFVFHDRELFLYIFIGLGATVARFLNIDFYYYGKKKVAIPTYSQLVGQAIYVIGILLFVKKNTDLKNLIILYVIYQTIGSIIMLVLYVRNNKLNISISVKNSYKMLKKTFMLGAAGRIENLVTSYPILIIPLFLSQYELGLYSSAFKFFTLILIVYSTIMLTIAPYLVDLRKKSIELQRKNIILLVSSLVAIGVLFSAFFLIFGKTLLLLLFGKDFGPAAPLVDLVSYFIIPFWPVAMLLGTILIYYGYDKVYLKSTIFNGIIVLILTPILVKMIGIGGAIYAIGIGNVGLIIIEFVYLQKLIPGILSIKNKRFINI